MYLERVVCVVGAPRKGTTVAAAFVVAVADRPLGAAENPFEGFHDNAQIVGIHRFEYVTFLTGGREGLD